MKNKIFSILIVFLFMFSIVSAGEFDFTPELRDNKLDFMSKIRLALRDQELFTAAGEQRGCSDDPDRSKIYQKGQLPSSIDCSGPCGSAPCLINVYSLNQDGSFYYWFEREGPYSTSGLSNSVWAFETYCCPQETNICDNGDTKCASEYYIKKCVNNDWTTEKCPSGEKCDLSGKCNSVCTPKWLYHNWGECKNGIQTRVCYDSRSCGKGSCPVSTSRSCTEDIIDETPTVDDDVDVDDDVTPPPVGTICCRINVVFEGQPYKHEFITQSQCDGKVGTKVSDDACNEAESKSKVVIYKVEPTISEVNPGKEVPIIFSIRNPTRWARYNLKVECAIYKKEFAEAEGLMSLVYGRKGAKTIDTCGGEGFVDALQISSLYANGGDKTFFLKPKAPTTESKFANDDSAWDGLEKDYAIVCGYYEACGSGYITFKTSTIKVTGIDLTEKQHFECVGTTLVEADGVCPTTECPLTQADCVSSGGKTGEDGEIIDMGCSIPWLNPYSSILTTEKTCSESFTKKEYSGKSETEVLNTVCEQAGNCKPRGDDYTVPECKTPDSVSVKIKSNPFQWFIDQFKTAKPGVCVVTSTTGIEFGEPFCIGDFCLPIWQWIVGVVLIVFLSSMMMKRGA